MRDYHRSLICLLIFLVLQHITMALWFDISRPPVHDEDHFVPTIHQFADQFNLETLRTYNEMNTPLPFAIYAAWGKLFSFQPATLRLLSLLIAMTTYVLIHQLVFTAIASGRTAFWTTVFIAVHPYMMSLAVLIYTDMLAICFATWACLAMLRRRPVQVAVALACAMLSRQFAVVYVVAFAIGLLFEQRWQSKKDTLRLLMACVLSVVPLAVLCLLWGGLSPDNVISQRYLSYPMAWRPASFVLYVAQLSLYLLPLLILRWRAILWRPQVLAWALALGAMAIIFPVRVSQIAKLHNAVTVGFFATRLHMIFADPFSRDMVWLVFFVAGLAMLLTILGKVIRNADREQCLLFELIVLAFILIMPLSYMHWEKYFMLILPAACIAVLQIARKTPEDSSA